MINTNWNLSHLYASNDLFLMDLNKSKELLKNLEKFKNNLKKNDKKIILNYFKLDDEFSIILEKLAVYAKCKLDDDGKNEDNLKNYQLISDFFSEINQKLAFSKTELSSLSDEFLLELEKDKDFSDYNRQVNYILRNKQHTLSEDKEIMIASISAFQNFDDIYSNISDIEMNHGTFVNENGEVIELSNGNYASHLKNPSQNIRKEVMKNFLSEYGKLNLTYSALYLSHVKYMNFLAREKGFKSVLEMLTYKEEVSDQIIRKNIENVSAKANLIQDYFEIKKQYLKLDKFYSSDISANFSDKKENVDYEIAVKNVRDSFLPLGEEYVSVFEKAISEGWIDALPRKNKASGGYTISNFGNHPYILLNFDGTDSWASAIAHEFGHAMHSYYSESSQPYSKAQYTIFVAEVASLTNEILYNYHMLKKETDNNKKIQIISELLQVFYLNVFDASLLAEFEIYVHESLQKGVSLTAKELNEKYFELNKKYFGNKVVLTDEYVYNWSRKHHIFRDYYLYKYSTGFVSAATVAQKIIKDKTGEYVKKYKEFLKLGGSLDPVNSLKVADVDILSNATYDSAFRLFESYLNELKILTKEK